MCERELILQLQIELQSLQIQRDIEAGFEEVAFSPRQKLAARE